MLVAYFGAGQTRRVTLHTLPRTAICISALRTGNLATHATIQKRTDALTNMNLVGNALLRIGAYSLK